VRAERLWALFKTLIFTVVVPGSVAVLIPYRWISPGAELKMGLRGLIGALVTGLGALIYLWCAWSFAFQGLGTPAPVDPPKTLVATGLYRLVRNPMYVGVELVVAGEAILYRSWKLAGYAALVWIAFHLFVMLYEEPTLRKKFGASYAEYQKTVPRWIPKLRGGR